MVNPFPLPSSFSSSCRYGKNRTLCYALTTDQQLDVQSFVLRFLKRQCPALAPAAVFTDGATTNELDITDVFPSARHLLCAFHIFTLDVRRRILRMKAPPEVEQLCSAMRFAKTEEKYDAAWAKMQATYPAFAS